jgi:hypothetical protein
LQVHPVQWVIDRSTQTVLFMRKIIMFLLAITAVAAGAAKPAKFFARRDYPGNGYTIRMADINGDKIPDLIKTSGGVTTLLGNGTAPSQRALRLQPASGAVMALPPSI